MLTGVLGRKIGMTQVFSENKVVPVTVVDLNHWYVTLIRTQENDGIDSIQCGLLREKYQKREFSREWLKKPKMYFSEIKEVKRASLDDALEVGQPIDFAKVLVEGQEINVFGVNKGRGFQGVVKRHGFAGGRASHGPRFGRIPGSVSFMRSRGRVIKGKRLPGQMGNKNCFVKGLKVVRIELDSKLVLVKGAVPGASGSSVYIQKV